jgi:hypothetical protein
MHQHGTYWSSFSGKPVMPVDDPSSVRIIGYQQRSSIAGRPGEGLGSTMMFTKRLREGVRRGEITCSVRFWLRPHVTVGTRYRMEDGEIEVDSIETIGFPDITPEIARASGFLGVLDLLKVAKHGKGEIIYLVRFHYVPR